jgi:hypothetical protein
MRIVVALVVLVVSLAAPGVGRAAPGEVARHVPQAALVGEARYTALAIPIFDAQLYAPAGRFAWGDDFALTLTYHRRIQATALADRTLLEMARRHGGDDADLEPLRRRFADCFANVRPGDRITGVSTSPERAYFYFNGAQRCALEWPNLRRLFFGIWLEGQDRRFAARLRGLAP